MSKFEDDDKLLRKIKDDEDCNKLQEDLNEIHKWRKKCEMVFNEMS